MKSTLAFAIAVAAFGATSASADTLALLSNGAKLTIVDTKTAKVMRSVTVSGINGSLLGIDVRPADGQLYALADDGTVYTVDTTSGKATMKVKLDNTLSKGVKATVDFNPAADRLRIVGSDGTNLRANVDDGKVLVDGKLKYADADAAKGKMPMIAAGAYSNSFKGTKETALYNIDMATGAYVKQAPPNDGILNTLGKVGIKGQTVAFDIASDGQGGNRGWVVADGKLMSIDIASGAVTPAAAVASLPANVRDLAVLAQ
jgi:outer membrane protein assembly factor BamB